MKSLHVEIHPKKTWLGKVKNGFDFLGFRISPITIQRSTESLLPKDICRDSKVAQLYEQGASKKRIGQYLRKWLGWARLLGATSIGLLLTTTALGAPFAPACYGGVFSDISDSYIIVADNVLDLAFVGLTGSKVPLTFNINSSAETESVCVTANLPDTDDAVCEGQPFQPTLDTPFYVTTVSNVPTTCVFETTISTAAGGSTIIVRNERRTVPTAPTAVPLFTPIGLIATIGGLLWFGRRRKAMKVTTD